VGQSVSVKAAKMEEKTFFSARFLLAAFKHEK
jgi:hypothetical protein